MMNTTMLANENELVVVVAVALVALVVFVVFVVFVFANVRYVRQRASFSIRSYASNRASILLSVDMKQNKCNVLLGCQER
jgi:flagellar biosynthesis/type III secretory pathway M-ring protein FliF/YscJ